MTRIAVGGFLHETNTFAPTKATYDDFVHGGGWPAMAQGADVLKVMRNINVGLAGFVEAAEANGWELVPTISCGASPSAHVTRDAFERIVKVMVDGIAAAGPLDAVYLDLHGAMVTEHLDDGEGEILARVRQVIGKDLPLVVSLDLHANVTPEMVEHADALIAYRTYPHVDMADTGRACRKTSRAAAEDEAALRKGVPAIAVPDSDQLAMHQRPADQGHLSRSSRRWRATRCRRCPLRRAFRRPISRDCGPSVFAYGRTQADADAAADTIAALIESHEDDFDGRIYHARRRRAPRDGTGEDARSKPIIIADTQDNPGAGGDSDTTGMLRALVRNNATRAAIGVIYDPAIGQGRACGRRRRHRHAGARRQVRHSRRCALQGNLRRRKTVRRTSSSRPAPIMAAATWTWGRRPACASATSAWSSARTRRSSPISRCTAMSASSRPSRPSSSTRARCISAPISSRSPKSF